MIRIKPSDLLESPRVNVVNDNAYGSVVSTLSSVYQISDNVSDLNINILTSGNGFEDLSQQITNDAGDVIGNVYDLGTRIRNLNFSFLGAGDLDDKNYKYKEAVYKTIKIELFKDLVNIQSVNSIDYVNTSKSTTYYFGKSKAVRTHYKNLVTEKSKSLVQQSSILTDMFSVNPSIQITEESTSTFNGEASLKSITEDEDKIVIQIDFGIQTDSGEIKTDWFARKVYITSSKITSFSLSFNSKTIMDKPDKSSSIYKFIKNQKQYHLQTSELLQNDAIVKDEAGISEETLFNDISKNIVQTYKNGLQTIECKCKITEYADDGGVIQINPVKGETFNIGDIVSVNIDKYGDEVPVSTYVGGGERLFKVCHSEIVYDRGKIYIDLKAKEMVAHILYIQNNPEIRVYKNGQLVESGATLYTGDALLILKKTDGYNVFINSKLYDFKGSVEVGVDSDIYITTEPKTFTLSLYGSSTAIYETKTVTYNEPIGELPALPVSNFLNWRIEYMPVSDSGISTGVWKTVDLTPETIYFFDSDMSAYAVRDSSGGTIA